MLIVTSVIAGISGVALIVAVVMQTTKADSFSAAMGAGVESSKFRKGSREDWLEKITRYSAIVWLLAMVVYAVQWYHSR